jgi:glucose/mannose-6-phosphate isomerase
MTQLLDDIKAIKQLDSQDMFGMVAGLPGQLEQAYAAGAGAIEDPGGEVGGIAVAGMGGSAIGSDLVANVYDVSLPSPLVTVRNYHLPQWLDSRSLVFTVSYSGNTEESVSCLGEALERGCRTICVSSGGKMGEIAASEGLPLIEVPAGYQPRAALGWLSVPIASCLESLGLVEGVEVDIAETLAVLDELRGLYGPETPTVENPAKQLAVELKGKTPLIYGCELTAVAARRWKCQINENANNMAFAAELPELDHNEIVGWEQPAGSLQGFAVVFLADPGIHPQNRKRIDATRDIVASHAASVHEFAPLNGSRLTRLFASIFFGDYLSLYLAILNGVDPSPVSRIEDLKRQLS